VSLQQAEIEEGVRRGLAREEFVLHYQPQFHVPTGRPVALEALVRWDLGGHALVPPKRFMPHVADGGLHMELLRSSLAVTLLASGVETKDEYRLLTEWGCHLVQGNLLSPALPPEGIAAAVFARGTDNEVER
jgi:EAL domain-containing protein (putative c-di-GMP-specific phosphodiesterase class I)